MKSKIVDLKEDTMKVPSSLMAKIQSNSIKESAEVEEVEVVIAPDMTTTIMEEKIDLISKETNTKRVAIAEIKEEVVIDSLRMLNRNLSGTSKS